MGIGIMQIDLATLRDILKLPESFTIEFLQVDNMRRVLQLGISHAAIPTATKQDAPAIIELYYCFSQLKNIRLVELIEVKMRTPDNYPGVNLLEEPKPQETIVL